MKYFYIICFVEGINGDTNFITKHMLYQKINHCKNNINIVQQSLSFYIPYMSLFLNKIYYSQEFSFPKNLDSKHCTCVSYPLAINLIIWICYSTSYLRSHIYSFLVSDKLFVKWSSCSPKIW